MRAPVQQQVTHRAAHQRQFKAFICEHLPQLNRFRPHLEVHAAPFICARPCETPNLQYKNLTSAQERRNAHNATAACLGRSTRHSAIKHTDTHMHIY
ncbi:hypothetical protein BanimalisJ1_08960 [Bifidobacterium animalis]|nr:hypothetical protein BanimalisJ1_08960 [Bifidobacterium animalis]GDZ99505.1 hypothetical protein BanimalisJ2_15250 [Bifidobacterium animalis]GDZ99904.1 hypothetical protein BanimalisJ3_03630 [Bifidobacterium animalis]